MRSIVATDVPMSRATSKIETLAASASVANVCRRQYGPRCAMPAASSAGYHATQVPARRHGRCAEVGAGYVGQLHALDDFLGFAAVAA